MSGVFINYRGGPHIDLVRGIYEQLVAHFGADQVFLDHRSMELGHRYPDVLRKRVLDSDVVLAVIDSNWLTARDADGTRLIDRDRDWVRMELDFALGAGKRIIPVLLDDAPRPLSAELPASIRDIAHRQSCRIHGERRSADVAALIPRLERDIAPTWEPTAGPARPGRRGVGRWPRRVAGIVAVIALLVAPAFLVRHDPPADPNSAPALCVIALMSAAIMLCVPVMIWVVYGLFGNVINSWEQVTHGMPVSRYNVLAIPALLTFIALLVWMTIQLDSPPIATLFTFAAIFLGVLRALVIMLRNEKEEKDLDDRWPHAISTPGDAKEVRGALGRLEGRMIAWTRPLSREQRDKAAWMLRTLGAARDAVVADAGEGRWRWLLADHPGGFIGYGLWVSATVGLMLAGLLPELRAGTVSAARMVWVFVVFAAACVALALLTLELGHHVRRRIRLRLAAEVTIRLRGLEARLESLTAAPRWEAIDLDPTRE